MKYKKRKADGDLITSELKRTKMKSTISLLPKLIPLKWH